MSGTPPGYESVHIGFHSLLLGGQRSGTLPDEFSVIINKQKKYLGAAQTTLDLLTADYPLDVYNLYDMIPTIDEPRMVWRFLGETELQDMGFMKWALTFAHYNQDFLWKRLLLQGKDRPIVERISSIASNYDENIAITDLSNLAILYEQSLLPTHFGAMGRTLDQLASNAVINNSAVSLSLYLLERDHYLNVAKYVESLRNPIEETRTKADFVMKVISAELQTEQLFMQEMQKLLAITLEAGKLYNSIKRQDYADKRTYILEEALWDYELYRLAGNVLASITGVAVMPYRPSPLERLIEIASPILSNLIIGGIGLLSLIV